MIKLSYEEWKEKYLHKMTTEELNTISNHGISNPQEFIDQLQLEAYNEYLSGFGNANNEVSHGTT